MTEHRIFSTTFASIYPLYVNKIERKNRTIAELDTVLMWLTGYSEAELAKIVKGDITLREFFDKAPHMNPHAAEISGVICGVRVEEIADPLMQKIRWMDKLVDELANGRSMDKVLRK